MNWSYESLSETRFFDLGEKLWDIIVLSALWIIFSLPIITCGAASSALYYAVYKRITKQSGKPASDFMHALKTNIKQGLPIHIIFTVYTLIMIFNIYFAVNGWGNLKLPDFYLPFALLLLLPLIVVYPFTYPYLARFSTDTKHILLHSAAFASLNPGKVILLWFITIISLGLMVILPLAIVTPYFAARLRLMIVEPIFEKAIETERRRMEASDE